MNVHENKVILHLNPSEVEIFSDGTGGLKHLLIINHFNDQPVLSVQGTMGGRFKHMTSIYSAPKHTVQMCTVCTNIWLPYCVFAFAHP